MHSPEGRITCARLCANAPAGSARASSRAAVVITRRPVMTPPLIVSHDTRTIRSAKQRRRRARVGRHKGLAELRAAPALSRAAPAPGRCCPLPPNWQAATGFPSGRTYPPPLLLPPELPGSQSFAGVVSDPLPPPELHLCNGALNAGPDNAPATSDASSTAITLLPFGLIFHLPRDWPLRWIVSVPATENKARARDEAMVRTASVQGFRGLVPLEPASLRRPVSRRLRICGLELAATRARATLAPDPCRSRFRRSRDRTPGRPASGASHCRRLTDESPPLGRLAGLEQDLGEASLVLRVLLVAVEARQRPKHPVSVNDGLLAV
jgi:hypothetical protein